jgi:hypothetical protein
MLACFSRQRIVGAMIVVLACTLCVTPIFSRGKGASAAPAGSSDALTRVAHYPPTQPEQLLPPSVPLPATPPTDGFSPPPAYGLPRPGTIVQPAPLVPQPTPDHVVESKAFSLVSTKYRLTTGKAKALAQFLEDQIGRPEIFEISVEEPEAITIVASPTAQKTVAELVGLMRTSPGKARETHPTAIAP